MKPVMTNSPTRFLRPFVCQFEVELSQPAPAVDGGFPESTEHSGDGRLENRFPLVCASKVTLVKQETTDDE